MVERQNICIIASEKSISDNLKRQIEGQYSIHQIQDVEKIFQIARTQPIHVVLCYINEKTFHTDNKLFKFKEFFPKIPLIGIMNNQDIEIARKCGEIGFNKVWDFNKEEFLINEINEIIHSSNNRITIESFPINLNLCTDLAKKILFFIEKRYLQIFDTNIVLDELSISESRLVNELKQNNLPNFKKIVLLFKIKHSILLMQNNGLNLTEISELSGFTNNKRFGECFMKVFNMTPKTYRNKLKEYNDENSNNRQWN
jgi:AraC-like DNA-binding protein